MLYKKPFNVTFRVYFCLEFDGDTITQIVTINRPVERQEHRDREAQGGTVRAFSYPPHQNTRVQRTWRRTDKDMD